MPADPPPLTPEEIAENDVAAIARWFVDRGIDSKAAALRSAFAALTAERDAARAEFLELRDHHDRHHEEETILRARNQRLRGERDARDATIAEMEADRDEARALLATVDNALTWLCVSASVACDSIEPENDRERHMLSELRVHEQRGSAALSRGLAGVAAETARARLASADRVVAAARVVVAEDDHVEGCAIRVRSVLVNPSTGFRDKNECDCGIDTLDAALAAHAAQGSATVAPTEEHAALAEWGRARAALGDAGLPETDETQPMSLNERRLARAINHVAAIADRLAARKEKT